MRKSDFYFELPPELIAQYPLANRSDSRLLLYSRKTGVIEHAQFKTLADHLQAGDLLVMNDSRVIPARLFASKITGGKVELLVERILSDDQFLAHIRSSKSPKPGVTLSLDKDWLIKVLGREGELFLCKSSGSVDVLLQQLGHIPLPPYIARTDEVLDLNRYQTIYAKHKGSVAAPTAGLHFDDAVIKSIESRGIEIAYVTLHVGAGTFQPVRVDNVDDHRMHFERFSISQALCDAVQRTRERKGRVIAVGTTALRSLESAVLNGGELRPVEGDTNIFIKPGYQFQVIDGLLTNFHLPESTLLMLVSALIGHQQTMSMYQTAIEKGYRFFSYGDTSLLL